MPTRYLLPPRAKYAPEAGDILAFSGTGFTSRIISARTFSRYSHVGIVADIPSDTWDNEDMAAKFPFHGTGKFLFESTTLTITPCAFQGTRVRGPQAVRPDERVQGYPGSTYVLRLRDPLKPDESEALTSCLFGYLGTEYDSKEAFLSSTYLLKLLKLGSGERLFCSEYVGRGLIEAGRLNHSDPSDWTPARLIRLLLDACIYHPPRQIVWRDM